MHRDRLLSWRAGRRGERRRIVMIGSAPQVRGGISAMVRVCYAHGLFERGDAEYLPTHEDGSKTHKAWVALRAWLAFLARLAAGRVALLHVHIASGASFWRKLFFVLPAHACGVPYLLQMHGGDFDGFYEANPGPVRALIGFVYRNARAVLALSPEWRERIAARVPGARVLVVPNPVAIPAQAAAHDADPPCVLFLGILREAKGVFDLLRAWPAVRRAVPRARLVLAGTGEMEQARDVAERGGFGDALTLTGWIGGAAKQALLHEASVLVLPSHAEALPMSILESMAAGLPVVATRVGGIPDLVEEGRTGLLVAPRDSEALAAALVELLTDRERRRAMGAAGRARARERFSADVVVPRIEAIWRNALGEGRPL